jgi:adenosylcobinamide-GDP ribazoletransferase
MHLTKPLLADLVLCLSFSTRLPLASFVPDGVHNGFERFPRALRLLPLAGAIIGAFTAAGLTIASGLGLSAELASAIAIGATLFLTGALHEDGLADCADGLGGGNSRERKLEIMRDSRIGTYGTIAIALVLYLRIECLAVLVTKSSVLAGASLISAAAVSRAAALVPAILLRPARSDGLGHAAGRPDPGAFLVAMVLAAVSAFGPIASGANPRSTLVGLAAAAGMAILVTGLARRHIGGQTGDIAGAVQQCSELGILLALAAR